MTVGLQLLHSIVVNGARDVFRGLHDRFFTEDEIPTWRFVTHYFDTYGALPPPSVLYENGFNLPMSEGTLPYLRDMLRDRAIYNIYNREQQRLLECIHANSMTQFLMMFDAMVQEMHTVESARDTFTLAEAMALVLADYEVARANPGMRGVTYGWNVLDDLTGGARAGDLITIVARPGLGKALYGSQKQHWQEWLEDYARRKAEGGDAYRPRTAEFIYNRIMCPPMLYWLAEGAGVPEVYLGDAYRAVLAALPRPGSRCAALRRVVPWRSVVFSLKSSRTAEVN